MSLTNLVNKTLLAIRLFAFRRLFFFSLRKLSMPELEIWNHGQLSKAAEVFSGRMFKPNADFI
jgi:hypothetical protein